ncbi:helix-turn-helix domain-containing protein [Kribbella albertanoniae]|uniref:XRE family transcriptional regulator n=1 Tax=Kribbella albertanoniae TaxID=1266829 RepID=A0A4R4QEN1_9ACTN|nr:XRE family transcriptional regulator [Kribbella albertanoniae]TDC34061.1 XRE family transcriptional regulator [Kribbella albertanoniae]
MNEVLRRAMYDAGLTELDLSVELSVDPKTVRNWMRGQVPHPGRRASLERLLGVDVNVVWPELNSSVRMGDRPSELAAVYPRRDLLKSQDWLALFDGARSRVDLLTFSASFLLDDSQIIQLFERKCAEGVRMRFALALPNNESAEADEAVADQLRGTLRLVKPLLRFDRFQLRLHRDVVYSSLYRADDDLIVNQHAYGVPAAESPLFHYRRTESSEIFDAYETSLETIWSMAAPAPLG